MPQIVNFDVLTCDTVDVQKTVAGVPRVWHLRDDVSAETMIRFFELARAEKTAEAGATDARSGVAASFRAADRVYMSVLVDIFRHTYPDMSAADTEADLRAVFTFEERKQLVDLFFSLAGIGSNGPSSAAPSSTPAPATSNRAARRAKKPQPKSN